MDKPGDKKINKEQLEDILASNRYVGIENQEEVDAYWQYLSYRVQRALFEICQEDSELNGMSWRDFVLIVRHRKQIRDAVVDVLYQTIEKFRLDRSHASSEIEFFHPCEMEDAEDGIFHAAVLSSHEEGRAWVEWLFLRMELACYQNQVYTKEDYTWDKFINELLLGQQLWGMLRHTFQNVLTLLDFKAAWREVGIDIFLETVNELKECAEE